eukprot:scaffold7895_cov57-Phaeocystis_antarctica.AAC.2
MRRCGPGARPRRHRQLLRHRREESLHLPTARAQQCGAAGRAEGVRLERRQREVERRACTCTCGVHAVYMHMRCTCTCGVHAHAVCMWRACGMHALCSVSVTARPRQTRPTARLSNKPPPPSPAARTLRNPRRRWRCAPAPSRRPYSMRCAPCRQRHSIATRGTGAAARSGGSEPSSSATSVATSRDTSTSAFCTRSALITRWGGVFVRVSMTYASSPTISCTTAAGPSAGRCAAAERAFSKSSASIVEACTLSGTLPGIREGTRARSRALDSHEECGQAARRPRGMHSRDGRRSLGSEAGG